MSNTENSAKAEILDRLRNAAVFADAGRDLASDIGIDYAPSGKPYTAPRNYEREHSATHSSLVALADERIADYRANVVRCSVDELPSAIVDQLEQAGVTGSTDKPARIGVPPKLEQEWLAEIPRRIDSAIVVDSNLSVAELDQLDAIVTSSAVTCAETGTIFLRSDDRCGRRALTLVPDVHVCIVPADSIVYGIPEAITFLKEHDPTVPVTMISGPSATSDIELERVEGVHGPRTLNVIIVE